MKKSTFLTIIALYIANIFAIGIVYRFVFKPITENISHDTLLAWVYDSVLLTFFIQIIFLGLILILLVYSMLPTPDETNIHHQAKKTKGKDSEKEIRKEKLKKPKQKGKTEESEFTKEWKKLQREAK